MGAKTSGPVRYGALHQPRCPNLDALHFRTVEQFSLVADAFAQALSRQIRIPAGSQEGLVQMDVRIDQAWQSHKSRPGDDLGFGVRFQLRHNNSTGAGKRAARAVRK